MAGEQEDPVSALKKIASQLQSKGGRQDGASFSRPAPEEGSSPARQVLKGVLAWLVVVGAVVGWLHWKADDTTLKLAKITPASEAVILLIKDTQIVEAPKPETTPEHQDEPDAATTQDAATTDPAAAVVHDAPAPVFDPADRRPKIAVILTDLGLDKKIAKQAINDLPRDITLAFSPYSETLPDLIDQSHANGHQTMLALPMEPKSYPRDDPGPKALLSRQGTVENLANLNWNLERGKGVIGVINFMGSRFLNDQRNLEAVFIKLKELGLLFVETDTGVATTTAETASPTDVDFFKADLQIDVIPDEYAIRDQLAQLVKLAKEKGYAVGVAQPYPVTLRMLDVWSKDTAGDDIALVPITVIAEELKSHATAP